MLFGSALFSPLEAQVIHFSTAQVAGESNQFLAGGVYWNKLVSNSVGERVSNAVDKNNLLTGVKWTTDIRFGQWFNNGPAVSTEGYPTQISQNGMFLNKDGSTNYPSTQFTISGLTPGGEYELTFYGSMRAGDATFPTRSLDIEVTARDGVRSGVLTELASSTQPAEAVLSMGNVFARNDGTLVFNMEVSNGFMRGNLNALTIVAVPEPGALVLLALGAGGWVLLRRRTQRS